MALVSGHGAWDRHIKRIQQVQYEDVARVSLVLVDVKPELLDTVAL